VEIAVEAKEAAFYIGAVLFVVGLFFVWRSFYGMRISRMSVKEAAAAAKTAAARA
jgi:hypothetical protein